MADTSKGNAEARAMWVVRYDLTSPEQIKQAIAYAKNNNFNMLFVQVRGRGDAYYNSHFEPRSEALEEQPADFDPLKMYVEEGHKAGLQIFAWMNTHLLWSSSKPPKSPEHVVNKHPEWLMHTRDNKVSYDPAGETEGAYTCPSNPQVKEHVKNCFLDVVKNYDVDGINFDYVRYPNTGFCFCDGCMARFKARMDKEISPEQIATLGAMKDRLAYVQAFPEKYDQFRRDQIIDLVGQIYRGAKAIKPKIIVTADVFPEYDDAYSHRFQDWKAFMKLGIMDILCPMAYTKSTEAFGTQIEDAVKSSNGRFVYAGIGQWQNDLQGNVDKIQKAREVGAQGTCLFAYSSATKDGTTDEFLGELKKAVFQEPVPVPETDWIK